MAVKFWTPRRWCRCWLSEPPTRALQLAAAFVAAENRPSALEAAALDDSLAEAARKEGFVLAVV